MSFIERLAPLRSQPGTRLTTGLDDATLTALSANHPQLIAAVDAAAEEFARVQADLGPMPWPIATSWRPPCAPRSATAVAAARSPVSCA